MKLQLSIMPKLALVFVLFAAVLLAGVSALAYTNGRAALQLATTSDLLSTAIEKESALQNWVEERQSDIAALAASPHLRDDLAALLGAPNPTAARVAHDRLVAELQPNTAAKRTYLDLLVLEPKEGMVIAATNPSEEGTFKEDRRYFIVGKRSPYVQNPYYSSTLQTLAMTASAPLTSADGRLLGVLVARLNMDGMKAIVARRSSQHQTDDVYLVNTSSLFVTQPRLLGDPAVLQRGVHTEHVRRCLTRASGTLLAGDYRGIPVIAVYRWLAERQLCLVVKLDQTEAFAPARTFGMVLLLIGGLALLVASVVAIALARTITRPLLALQAAAARFGRGELSVRLSDTSGDELGLLAREFNAMASSLAEKEAQLEQKVEARTAELRRSEERHRALFEQAGDGIFISDANGNYVEVNAKGCAMLGYSHAEILEKSMSDLIPAEDRTQMPPRLVALHAGQTVIAERRLLRKDGALLPVEISGKMLSDGRLQGIVRDITERKQAEAALAQQTEELTRSNAELEQFAYVASHDLQEPLRMVASYTQLLARRYKGQLDSDADEFIAYAVDGANRMQTLINDLLAYSRVGTRGNSFESVDCNVVLDRALANLKIAIKERDVLITHDHLPVVWADAVQLVQVFQNLIANAIKFGATESPRIHVAAKQRGAQWVFSVCDNGIGIEPQYAERIFIIFQRLHTRDQYPGTGIGLAICKKIVERHSGRIWVEPQADHGSMFCFSIPDHADERI